MKNLNFKIKSIKSALVFTFCLFGFQAVVSQSAIASSGLVCQFWGKDYDSPGFGIPYRSGFYIKGRFGCFYRCTCPNGKATKVTHVLEEKHLSMNVFSNKTGGPHAAKWFICPHSVKEETWTPYRDELGRVIAYNVEANEDPFDAELISFSPQIRDWAQSCQE